MTMSKETIKELECRLHRDLCVPGQLFSVRPEGQKKDGISRELWGGAEYATEPRLKSIPRGAKVRLSHIVITFIPQEIKSVSGKLRWESGCRGRQIYSLTERSEVVIIETCKHEWNYSHSIGYDEGDPEDWAPGHLKCWVDSHCSLCGSYDWGQCEPDCPNCGGSMDPEEAYVPEGYVWTCDDCLCSRPLEFGWIS